MCIRPETSFDTQGLLIRSIISLLSVCLHVLVVEFVTVRLVGVQRCLEAITVEQYHHHR
eukprot:COSAG06_NODE_17637_length_928_cov_27.944511_1_plen_58_part_10